MKPSRRTGESQGPPVRREQARGNHYQSDHAAPEPLDGAHYATPQMLIAASIASRTVPPFVVTSSHSCAVSDAMAENSD